MKQKISILGCGWLGLSLGESLIKAGYFVRGSTTTQEKLALMKAAGIDPYLLSVDDYLRGENVSNFFQSDVLFLNLPYRRDLIDPRQYQRQINAAIDFVLSSEVRWVIFASSTSIYPDNLENASEDAIFDLSNDRAKVLWEIEQSLMMNKNFSSTVLRFAGLFGADRKIGNFLRSGKIVPQALAPVNLIHQDDCVEIIKQIIERKILDTIFNLVCNEHPTKKDLYTQAALGLKVVLTEFNYDSKGPYKIVSNHKIKSALNYQFKYPDPRKCV